MKWADEMSEPTREAFPRSSYEPGSQQTAQFPSHEAYGQPPPAPPEGHEAELTAGYGVQPGQVYGFLTDTSICIGCKACEVACKEWNNLPADNLAWLGTSYDNTLSLSHKTWRHVSFVEQAPKQDGPPRWLFQSDICKHCDHAGCLEACPTGSIVRSEFGSVVIQQDICNGCQYCVPSCPYGVITVGMEEDGKAHKCTLCYDRLKGGMEPACSKSCPTDSIQFGPIDALRSRARERVRALNENGFETAQLYGYPEQQGATGGVGGLRSFFLLMDRPNVYNLPEAPRLPSRNIGPGLLASAATAALLVGFAALSFLGGRKTEGGEHQR